MLGVTSKNRITVSSSFIEYVSTVCGNPYDDYPKIVTVHSNNKLAVLNARYFTMHSLATEDTIQYMYIYNKSRTLHKQCELTPDDWNNLMSLKIEIMYMCVPHTNVNTEQLCKDLTCYLTNCIAGLTNDTTLDIVTITTPSIATEAIYIHIDALSAIKAAAKDSSTLESLIASAMPYALSHHSKEKDTTPQPFMWSAICPALNLSLLSYRGYDEDLGTVSESIWLSNSVSNLYLNNHLITLKDIKYKQKKSLLTRFTSKSGMYRLVWYTEQLERYNQIKAINVLEG